MSEARGPLDFDGDAGADAAAAQARSGHQAGGDGGGTPGGSTHGSSSSWSRIPLGLALLALCVLLVWVGLNTVNTKGVATTGLERGIRVPPFAAPLAGSTLDGDVNVARAAHQGAAGRVPACSVRGAGILNSCDLLRGHPAVLAFFTVGQPRCSGQLDRLEQVRARYPRIAFAAVALGGDRGRLRSLIEARRFSFPVAYDRDSVLANLFGIAVCPLVTYVDRHGRVAATGVGVQSTAELVRRLDALEGTRTGKG